MNNNKTKSFLYGRKLIFLNQNKIKLKPQKIIFSILIFLSLFLSFSNTGLSDELNQSTKKTIKIDKKIEYKPQISLGEYKAGKEVEITPDSIGKYIAGIYNYSISIVGILASMVIMWGGVRWLTAGGDSSAVDDAKKWIEGALSGLVIAMTSYIILYFINPDLTTFKLINITSINSQSESAHAVGDAESAKIDTHIAGDTCKKYKVTEGKVIDFDNMRITKTISTKCYTYNKTFNSAVEGTEIKPDLLQAISMAESGCDANIGRSSAGACGIMQLLPSTAKEFLPSDTQLDTQEDICQYLEKNPRESIQIAAKYIAQNQETHNLKKTADLIAGYNSGYGTKENGDGKLPALAPSENCKGHKAYECCIQPGGLAETQEYVKNVKGYYNGFDYNEMN